MHKKKMSGALVASVLVHIIILLIAGLYFVSQSDIFQNLIHGDTFELKPTPKPKVHKQIFKKVSPPIVSVSNTVVSEPVAVQPRFSAVMERAAVPMSQTVSEFSNKAVNVHTTINPNVPKVVQQDARVPSLVTSTELPISDAPSVLSTIGPAVSAPQAGQTNIARGMVGNPVQVKIAIQRPPGLSFTHNVGAATASVALDKLSADVQLGNVEVQPPPKGEPYGMVVGRGRDIRGYLRFTRIRHNLSDWWADSSSLNALTKWLNERTGIKTDMNVEGGAIKLTDANLQKTPIAFMTGHDPSLVRSRNLLGRQQGGGKLDSRLSDAEVAGLRKYLVEKGGFLVFDDCGVNAAAQAMVRLFLTQMRHVMPENHIERIDNGHEIYHNYYAIGGPPVGFDIFWWGTRPPKRNYLEGFSVGEKLSVLVVRRDYMCAMEAVSLPTRSVHYSPGVYRFMTNVVIYALTHGSISNYTRYVPEDALVEKRLPTNAPQAAKIRAID